MTTLTLTMATTITNLLVWTMVCWNALQLQADHLNVFGHFEVITPSLTVDDDIEVDCSTKKNIYIFIYRGSIVATV